MSFEAWETAMGMSGYVGSPAQLEDRREAKRLSFVQRVAIENIAVGKLPWYSVENRRNWRTTRVLKRRGLVDFDGINSRYVLTERGRTIASVLLPGSNCTSCDAEELKRDLDMSGVCLTCRSKGFVVARDHDADGKGQ